MNKSGGLLLIIGFVLYLIIQVGIYIFVALVVIVIVVLIFNIKRTNNINKIQRPPLKPTSMSFHNKIEHNMNNYKFRVSEVQYSKLNLLFKACKQYNTSVEMSKIMTRLMRYSTNYYNSKSFTRIDLFDYILEEINFNNERLNNTRQKEKIRKEYDLIVEWIQKIRNGVSSEEIILTHIQNATSKFDIPGSTIYTNLSPNENEVIDTKQLKTNISDNDVKFNDLKLLFKAYEQYDPSIENSNVMIRLMGYVNKFYKANEFVRLDLFEYVIEQANIKIESQSNSKQQIKITRECNSIIDWIQKIKNGVTAKEIILSNIEFPTNQVSKQELDVYCDITLEENNEVVSSYQVGAKQNTVDDNYELIIQNIEKGIVCENNNQKSKAIEFYKIGASLAVGCNEMYYYKAQKRLVKIYNEEGDVTSELSAIKEALHNLTGKHFGTKRWEERLHEIEVNNTKSEINVDDNSTNCAVPYWQHYYVYSANGLKNATLIQQNFYSYFKSQFINGIYLDLNENYNYAFILLFDLIDDYKKHQDLLRVQNELKNLGDRYPKTLPYTMSSLNKTIVANSMKGKVKPIITYPNIPSFKAEEINKVKHEPLIQQCKWIHEGQEVMIQGYKITKGNFYVGEKFIIPKQFCEGFNSNESLYLYASVINPELKIIRSSNEITLFHSYNDMPPVFRCQYLRWLAGELADVSVPNEIISLHMLGLELRLFLDVDTTDNERKSIIREVCNLRNKLLDRNDSRFNNFVDCAITKYFTNNPFEFVAENELVNFKYYKKYILNEHLKIHGVIDCASAYDFAKKWFCNSDTHVPIEYEPIAFQLFLDEFQKKYSNGISSDLYQKEEKYYINFRHINDGMFYPENRYLTCNIVTINYYIQDIENAIRCNCEKVYQSIKSLKENVREVTTETLSLLPKQIDILQQIEKDITITVSKELGVKEYMLPKQEQHIHEFTIDSSKLVQIEQDTAKSKMLLSEIFASDENELVNQAQNNKLQTKLFEILEILLQQQSWSRTDLEHLCLQRSLMVGSVLESINDYSYSIVDDNVIEDAGETIYITTQYKEQLICQNQ